MWRNVFWYKFHALTSNGLNVRPTFQSELNHYYLTLARLWQVSYYNPTQWMEPNDDQTITIFFMLWEDLSRLPISTESERSNHTPNELLINCCCFFKIFWLCSKIKMMLVLCSLYGGCYSAIYIKIHVLFSILWIFT